MTTEQHLLTILEEELIETAQRVSKAIRFGLQEVQKDQPLTNENRIMYEFNDIVAMLELLHEYKFMNSLPDMNNREMIAKKKKKVAAYMEYSKSLREIDSDITELEKEITMWLLKEETKLVHEDEDLFASPKIAKQDIITRAINYIVKITKK